MKLVQSQHQVNLELFEKYKDDNFEEHIKKEIAKSIGLELLDSDLLEFAEESGVSGFGTTSIDNKTIRAKTLCMDYQSFKKLKLYLEDLFKMVDTKDEITKNIVNNIKQLLNS